jgi:benzodiazapine receptor
LEVIMKPPSTAKSLLALAGFVAATASAARFGVQSSGKRRKIRYRTLHKPSFAPPDKVFPIVWTCLYALMAWSGWRVWRSRPSLRRSAGLALWNAQLAANAEWAKLFFAKHDPSLALADTLLLDSLIAAYIATVRGVDRAAARAFMPYLVWVTFATLLNAEIVRRNS